MSFSRLHHAAASAVLEQRWSEPPDPLSDAEASVFTGVLQKTSLLRASCSYAARFLMLTHNHYLYSFPSSYDPSDPTPPLSRISLFGGLAVVDNSDDAHGFALLHNNSRVKFIAPDMDTKSAWVKHLTSAIEEADRWELEAQRHASDASTHHGGGGGLDDSASSNTSFSTTATSQLGVGGSSTLLIDRQRSQPIKAGYLEKRDGSRFSSYHMRWVEIRRGVGLIFGKHRDAPDASFKRVRLLDQTVGVSAEKYRFSVLGDMGVEIFFRADSIESFASWIAAVEREVHPPRDRSGRRLTEEEIRILEGSGGEAAGGIYQRHASMLQQGRTPSSLTRRAVTQDQPPPSEQDRNENVPLVTRLMPPLRYLSHDDDDQALTVTPSNTVTEEPTEDGTDWDELTLFELRDLISEVPLHFVPDPLEGSMSVSPRAPSGALNSSSTTSVFHSDVLLMSKLFPKKRLRTGVKVYLETVSMLYDPAAAAATSELPSSLDDQPTEEAIRACAPRATADMLSRLIDRMYTPFVEETYAALNEHIVLLDLDFNELRQQLSDLMAKYGNCEAIRPTVVACDDVLRQYTPVRDALIVRRNIAAFRSQKDHFGLKLGVDGTLDFVYKLVAKDRGTPSEANYRRVHQLFYHLHDCLDHFRMEFDVFDESRTTIEAMELAMVRVSEWLAVAEPLCGASSQQQ